MPGTYISPAETGFYYLNSRYYDPETGRFINSDEYVFTGKDILGHNSFLYCNNNPIIYKDPSGKILLTALIVIGAGIIVGAGTGAYMSAAKGGSSDDIIEGMIEGAITGGVASAIGFFVPQALPLLSAGTQTAISFVAGGILGGAVDLGTQYISQRINYGQNVDIKISWDRVLESSIATGTAASIPIFNKTHTLATDAIGTALVSAESSVIYSTGVIIYDAVKRNMTLKERMFHGK